MRLPPLSHFYRHKVPLYERGAGRFHLLDPVTCGKRQGRIVEVVLFGMYPALHATLRVRGYYREHESYIVEDERGKRWWPRVGTLHLLHKEK